MANVVVLCKDERVRQQLEFFLKELGAEDLRPAFFKSQAEFRKLYFRKDKKPKEPPKDGEEASPTNEPFKTVHVLIFALDSIDDKPGPWVDEIRAKLRKFGYFPENGMPRLIMLKYEDDSIGKLQIMHPFLDDLIYLPLDRMIFLQKLQIILALPKRATPSFLFNQEVNQRIEISKIVRMEKLSDVGLAIRNPVALRKGLPGHFYFTPQGEKNRLEIKAKVLRSEPHPDHPGEFLVYFTFFGINRETLTTIRRTLSKIPHFKTIVHDDRERYRFNPNEVHVDESEEHIFGTLLIDTDEDASLSLSDTLIKEMDRLNVARESSYQRFLYNYMSPGDTKQKFPPRATDDSDFFNKALRLVVSLKDLACRSIQPTPKEPDLFLGHPAPILFASPEMWKSLISDKESLDVMEESARLAQHGREIEILVAMNDVKNQRSAVKLTFRKGPDEENVAIEIQPGTLQDIADKMLSDQKPKSLEAIVVDTDFVPEDPTSWIEGLRNRAVQIGMIKDPNLLKFWLLSRSDTILSTWLNNPDVLGLFIKPVDQRQILFSLSEHLPNKNTIYHFENIGWSQPGYTVHVSKEVQLEAISEYGATLRTKQKLAPGSIIYLRKSIYDNAPNGCLAARVYACEDHPKEKGEFQIFTTYFGINDAFLKFARTWIRENYAHAKTKGQSNG